MLNGLNPSVILSKKKIYNNNWIELYLLKFDTDIMSNHIKKLVKIE